MSHMLCGLQALLAFFWVNTWQLRVLAPAKPGADHLRPQLPPFIADGGSGSKTHDQLQLRQQGQGPEACAQGAVWGTTLCLPLQFQMLTYPTCAAAAPRQCQ